MEKRNRCVFMGLPSSGKSSFIAAFWHVVESGEISSTYSITTLPENRAYLNSLRTAWLECKTLDRTNINFPEQIKLEIKSNDSGKITDFIFPDVSGEMYEIQFEHRKLSVDYVNQIEETSGLLLFINPDHIKYPALISDAVVMTNYAIKPAEKIAKANEDMSAVETNIQHKQGRVWSHKSSQTQVILVDLLQIIKDRLPRSCKIGIVISAWDLIKDMPSGFGNILPGEWVSQQLPLLFQFLESNKKNFQPDYFGVSAQGGNYKHNQDVLLAFDKSSERIKVQHGREFSNDITVPIKWLLDGK